MRHSILVCWGIMVWHNFSDFETSEKCTWCPMASKILSVGAAVRHGQCHYKMMNAVPTDM